MLNDLDSMLDDLKQHPRLVITAQLAPVIGTMIQAAGFTNQIAAEYRNPKKEKVLSVIVDSPASTTNHLEALSWDEKTCSLVPELQGISYIKVVNSDKDKHFVTSSVLVPHRIASPYILEALNDKGQPFKDVLLKEVNPNPNIPFNPTNFHKLLAKYDLNSLLHGTFIPSLNSPKKQSKSNQPNKSSKTRNQKSQSEQQSMPLSLEEDDNSEPQSEALDNENEMTNLVSCKIQRALYGIIEADNVERVIYSGTCIDNLDPRADAKERKGNIIYSKQRYSTLDINAYFCLDLAQINNYKIDDELKDLLIVIALWKISRFLRQPQRLRSECDLSVKTINVSFVPQKSGNEAILKQLSDLLLNKEKSKELDNYVRTCIEKCEKFWGDNPVLTLVNSTFDNKKVVENKETD